MTRPTRALALIALVGLFSVLALPALAAEDAEDEAPAEEAVTTETAPLEFKTPAVSIVEPPEEEIVQPWTVRYLVPTAVLIAGLLVFGTVVMYFLRVVRARYKTVE